jgi:hypothetical protein
MYKLGLQRRLQIYKQNNPHSEPTLHRFFKDYASIFQIDLNKFENDEAVI